MSHLTTARRHIRAAMADPASAAALLSLAVLCIETALASVTPETPDGTARAIVSDAEALFAIVGCFEADEERC